MPRCTAPRRRACPGGAKRQGSAAERRESHETPAPLRRRKSGSARPAGEAKLHVRGGPRVSARRVSLSFARHSENMAPGGCALPRPCRQRGECLSQIATGTASDSHRSSGIPATTPRLKKLARAGPSSTPATRGEPVSRRRRRSRSRRAKNARFSLKVPRREAAGRAPGRRRKALDGCAYRLVVGQRTYGLRGGRRRRTARSSTTSPIAANRAS